MKANPLSPLLVTLLVISFLAIPGCQKASHQPTASNPKKSPLEGPAAKEDSNPKASTPKVEPLSDTPEITEIGNWQDSFPKALREKCASCHILTGPEWLPRSDWAAAVDDLIRTLGKLDVSFSPDEYRQLQNFYLDHSELKLPTLPYFEQPPGLNLEAQPIGSLDSNSPGVTYVSIVDLDQDGAVDVLLCDAKTDAVYLIRQVDGKWQEKLIAKVPAPARAEVFDSDDDGDLDLVVSALGDVSPSDELVGGVYLLINEGELNFDRRTIADGIARVADARPGDFDRDGDIDFSLAMFGLHTTGGIGWIEQVSEGRYQVHTLSDLSGAIHAPVVDLDNDGRPDFVTLVAQQHEKIVAYLGQGNGKFLPTTIYSGPSPFFGCSGMEMVDLDRDGDLDVLFTNGDSLDISMSIRPYHGVQWLENRGGMKFEYHDIVRFYGAYRAVAGDMDGDGDLDIVATSFFNDWRDPRRQSLIWLENDGQQQFTPRPLANSPTDLITMDVGDINGDGLPEVVAGGHFGGKPPNLKGPQARRARVTLWLNQSPKAP